MFFAGNCEDKKGLLGLLSLIGGGSENSSKDGNSGDGSSGSGGSTNRPINILLSKMTIAEEQAKGTEIGTLTAESGTKPYTYELVTGTGDNADFSIEGDRLKSNKIFDFETKTSYSIRIKTTDKNKKSFEKEFTITIENIDGIFLSKRTITEEQAKGTVIGALTAEGTSSGKSYTYELVSGTGSGDNADFIIEGDRLKSNKIFDFETKASYSIRIQSTDKSKQTFTKAFTITISDVDELAIAKWTAGWRNNKAQTATITGNQINIGVSSADFLTEVTLAASANASISPDSNTVTDWSDKVAFTVTNAGKTKTYEVKVTVNGKDIIPVTNANITTTVYAEIRKLGNTENFNHIDVGTVTNMQDLFKNKTNFNGDISKWDVSKVTTMHAMFDSARAFNQDIGGWNVSKVTDMQSMFASTRDFNQNIGSWNVSKVTNMQSMFATAISFNQNIGGWNVSKVTNMRVMFYETQFFNQDIGDWDVSKVTSMDLMFHETRAFNQNIRGWTLTALTSCIAFSASAESFQSANKPNFAGKCTP